MTWTVYILQCADATLYTGITNDLEARLAKHAQGTGARYTRGRAPLKLVYSEPQATKSVALKREIAIKAMQRNEKLALAGVRTS